MFSISSVYVQYKFSITWVIAHNPQGSEGKVLRAEGVCSGETSHRIEKMA